METKKRMDPEPTPAPTEPMPPETHVAGEIAGGVLISSVIVASVSLWAVGFLGLMQGL